MALTRSQLDLLDLRMSRLLGVMRSQLDVTRPQLDRMRSRLLDLMSAWLALMSSQTQAIPLCQMRERSQRPAARYTMSWSPPTPWIAPRR